jgi:Patatin-like phospholipase
MANDLIDRLNSPGPKRILALDGGGVRGSLTLGYLEAIERLLRERYGRPDLRLCEYFDLIGGTSAGSILAAALALGMDTATVTEKAQDFIGKTFGKRKWKSWEALFDPEPLQESLADIFGDVTLGDARILTGLCIVTKRADTRSTWPLLNHPGGRYYEKNRGILLKDAIYASAAAPYFFVPIEFDVGQGEQGAFVDGGVSMAKNPALQLFLLATLKGFPFHWPTGEDLLSVTSIGTGHWQQRDAIEKVVHSKAWNWTREVPTMLIEDASMQAQLLLQYLSRTPTPRKIDAEVGDLAGDLLTPEPVLSYIRYDVPLEQTYLESLGFSEDEERIRRLREMSIRKNRDLLLRIGRAAAGRQVEPAHFRAAFDIP